MEVRLVVITSLLLCSMTKSQYFTYSSCRVTKQSMGDPPVLMGDGLEITGIKVQFNPNTTCHLRGVREFRGIKYGVLKLSDKVVLSFMRNKDTVRAENPKRFAINHMSVCPQPRFDYDSDYMRNLPIQLMKRLKATYKNYTRNQSEDCLFMNIFAPDTGE